MIDVFVDRCFSHNFDPSNADDAFLPRRIAFLNAHPCASQFRSPIYLLRGIVGRSSDMNPQSAGSGEISPRRPAILAELAMVVRNVGSLHDHRALLR